ncbi:MAG: tyrosine-type recombinase/integrase [Acidimicrobiales bacterium]
MDADKFLVSVQHDLMTGRYVDPRAGQQTVAEYAAQWVTRQDWRPSTHERAERVLRLYILPTFGARPLASVKAAHIDEWVRSLPLAPATALSIATTFGALLTAAVRDELLAVSPMAKATLPRVEYPPLVPLTVEQVHGLAECAPDDLRAAVVLGAATGMRQGEAMAVTADRIDWMRRELRVDRQLVSLRGAPTTFAPPKSKRGYRTIALPSVVLETLSAHIATHGLGRDGLLFHRSGGPVSRSALSERFMRTSKLAKVDATWPTSAATTPPCCSQRASALRWWPNAWATTSGRCSAPTATSSVPTRTAYGPLSTRRSDLLRTG